MQSNYLVQIVDRATGEVVQMEPGLQLERDLVADIVRALAPATREQTALYVRFVDALTASMAAKGVGIFRTEAAVLDAVKLSLYEVLVVNGGAMADALTADLERAVNAAFLKIKMQVRP